MSQRQEAGDSRLGRLKDDGWDPTGTAGYAGANADQVGLSSLIFLMDELDPEDGVMDCVALL